MLLSPALPHDGLKELLLQLGPTARRSGKELISTEGGKEAEKVARGVSRASTSVGAWLTHFTYLHVSACQADFGFLCMKKLKTPDVACRSQQHGQL